jgi:hypothetical protein
MVWIDQTGCGDNSDWFVNSLVNPNDRQHAFSAIVDTCHRVRRQSLLRLHLVLVSLICFGIFQI